MVVHYKKEIFPSHEGIPVFSVVIGSISKLMLHHSNPAFTHSLIHSAIQPFSHSAIQTLRHSDTHGPQKREVWAWKGSAPPGCRWTHTKRPGMSPYSHTALIPTSPGATTPWPLHRRGIHAKGMRYLTYTSSLFSRSHALNLNLSISTSQSQPLNLNLSTRPPPFHLKNLKSPWHAIQMYIF
jgi:hypothetical protein